MQRRSYYSLPFSPAIGRCVDFGVLSPQPLAGLVNEAKCDIFWAVIVPLYHKGAPLPPDLTQEDENLVTSTRATGSTTTLNAGHGHVDRCGLPAEAATRVWKAVKVDKMGRTVLFVATRKRAGANSTVPLRHARNS